MGKISSRFTRSVSERRYRHFSEEFKRSKVAEILEGRCTVSELCRVHELSFTSVYRWISLYSTHQRPTRTIVESKSDTQKILALQKRIAELERLVGQKQVQLEFKEKMIELAEELYKVDIKKKFTDTP